MSVSLRSEEEFVVKDVDTSELEKELNAFVKQGFRIEKLFEYKDQNTIPHIIIVAKYALIGKCGGINEEGKLREYLWLSHGHTLQYGDDGEMQCQECSQFGMWDYKREPIDKVIKTALKAREFINIQKLATPTFSGGEKENVSCNDCELRHTCVSPHSVGRECRYFKPIPPTEQKECG